MVEKICVVCGKVFNAKGRDKTCNDECSHKLDLKRKSDNYNDQRAKWRWYVANRADVEPGTGDLGSHIAKDENGNPDFEAEMAAVKKELKLRGLE